jgi:hypothetical protein
MKLTSLIIASVVFLTGCARPDLSKPIKVTSIELTKNADTSIVKYNQSFWNDEFRIPADWAGRFEVGKEYMIEFRLVEKKVEKN